MRDVLFKVHSNERILTETFVQVCLSGAGALAGLLAIAALNAQLTGKINLPLLLGCFGASATLLFGAVLLHTIDT